jgi:hypothetical protein
MSKKTFPKWLQVNDDGTLTISWKGNTELHVLPDIETALRQVIHILEQYGNTKIIVDNETIIIPGKIAELKKFKDITEKTLKFLKSNAIDFSVGAKIQNQIVLSQKEILANVDKEIEKDVKIYFAVMKRSLLLKKEIIDYKQIIRTVVNELAKSYRSLTDRSTQWNLNRIKNKISGKGFNLVNGFSAIIANPYKKRVSLPEVKRLENIYNVDSVQELQKIIKNAIDRLMVVIPDIESEITLPNQGRG